MRYKLRTLMILLAIMPPLLWLGWTKYEAWRAERERQRLFIIAMEAIAASYNHPAIWQAIGSLSQTPPPAADNSNQDTTRPDEN
jgi:hypothetical protein